jgi:hypothetical protein
LTFWHMLPVKNPGTVLWQISTIDCFMAKKPVPRFYFDERYKSVRHMTHLNWTHNYTDWTQK